MDDDLREKILQTPSMQSIRDHCRRTGMRTLKDEAFRLVEAGQTTFDEILGAVFVEEDLGETIEPAKA